MEVITIEYSFIDLFSGIGGFRIGLESVGMNCLFSSEIDNEARKTYQENFGELPYGDVTLLSIEDISSLPDFSVLAAGFPCQPFSISGQQQGFEDPTRGTLFFNIMNIVRIKNPRVVFLENVAHLVHHDDGKTFKVIVKSLKEEGYHVHHKVLDSSMFGVAQHRKRIFIVATKHEGFEFPLGGERSSRIIDIVEDVEHTYLNPEEYTLIDSPKVSPNGMKFVGYLNKKGRTNGVREGTLHLSRSHRQINRIYDINHIHPTLTASEMSGRYFVLDDKGVRKLTILECFRLQGFPEDFKRPSSLAQQYHQIGNSVTVPVIEAISKQILKHLEDN